LKQEKNIFILLFIITMQGVKLIGKVVFIGEKEVIE
jgi:hypothetical protein